MNKKVSAREYIFYGVGGFGKGLAGSFVALFALIYFTDAVGISPAVAGAIIAVSKVAVMLLLPFAGIKMDGGKSPFGRFRPYLLWLALIMGIVTAICFVSPRLYGVNALAGRIAVCFIAYLLWETAFNLHDVPFWSLASVVSDKEEIRSTFLSVANIVTTVAGAVPVVAVPYLTENFGDERGFLLGGLVFGLCGGVVAAAAFFGTQERITVKQDKVTVKESFKALWQTKPMIVFDLALLLAATVFCAEEAGTYAGKYLFGSADGFVVYPGGEKSFLPSELLLTVLVVLVGGGSAVGDAVFPVVFKKMGLKKSLFVFSVVGAAMCVIMYLLGFDRWGKVSFYLFLVYYFSVGVLCGAFECLKSNLIPECADYSEWKTGVRRDGTFFSVQVMVSQLIESVPVLALSAVLQISGYVEPEGAFVAQSDAVRQGIFIAVTLIPAGGMLLGLIPAAFYKYTGKFRDKVRAEIEERRKGETNGQDTGTV